MLSVAKTSVATMTLVGLLGCICTPAAADVRIEGQVQAGGGPLASSNVTLWAASSGERGQLAQTTSGSDGRFVLSTPDTLGADVSLYGRQGRRTNRASRQRRQSGNRADLGARQQTAGTRRHQRIHDDSVGMDQRAVSRWHRCQRQPARSPDRGRQRAEFRRSRDRRLRRNDSGRLQQH